nr:reverse transcriptase [Ipomoea batatas]
MTTGMIFLVGETEKKSKILGNGITLNWNKFWDLSVPPKVKNFVWRCVHGIIHVQTQLKHRGVDVVDKRRNELIWSNTVWDPGEVRTVLCVSLLHGNKWGLLAKGTPVKLVSHELF